MNFKEKKQYYLDRFRQALTPLSESERNYEILRAQIAMRFVLAEKEHIENIAAFEKETDSAKKNKLLKNLTDSALEFGIAKHQARYYGLRIKGHMSHRHEK